VRQLWQSLRESLGYHADLLLWEMLTVASVALVVSTNQSTLRLIARTNVRLRIKSVLVRRAAPGRTYIEQIIEDSWGAEKLAVGRGNRGARSNDQPLPKGVFGKA
jgi:hypothetical protein